MKWNVALPMAAGTLFVAACSSDQATAPRLRPDNGPALTISAPVPAGSKTCPNTGDGWTKIDNGSGNTGAQAWGSLQYGGKTLTVNVNDGYTLTLCVKSGVRVNDGNAVLYTIKGPEVNGAITIAQDISHTSWRVSGPPTTELQDLVVTKSADGTYDRTVTWELDKFINKTATTSPKSASYTGTPGSEFPITWDIVGAKKETLGNYKVSGAVFISNPNSAPVLVSVVDKLKTGTAGSGYGDAISPDVTVNCAPFVPEGKTSNWASVPAGLTISCSYDVDRTAIDQKAVTLNRAEVAIEDGTNIKANVATDPVEWEENLKGDDSGILTDNRYPTTGDNKFYEQITNTGPFSFTLTETFKCSRNADDYLANGQQIINATNKATLDLDGETDKEATATITVTCNGFKGETATGAGYSWGLTSGGAGNWFMYSPFAPVDFTGKKFALLNGFAVALDVGAVGMQPWGPTGATVQKVPLIAGQQYPVGELTITTVAGKRTMEVKLANGARFANVTNAVKVQALAYCEANKLTYVQPGQFATKPTNIKAPFEVPATVSVPGSTKGSTMSVPAACYGVHVDVLRFLGA
jgi:hypothetical protein